MVLPKRKIILSIILVVFLVSVFGVWLAAGVEAQENPNPTAAKSCDPGWYKDIEKLGGNRGFFQGVSEICWACGECGLCDFLGLTDAIARFLLALIGSVAFFMFIYGGFSFILSSGNSEKVESSKKILVNAVIGIAIVLLAWEIVNVVIGLLAGQSIGAAANIFGKPWWEVCKK
jgi:hypothetical protein